MHPSPLPHAELSMTVASRPRKTRRFGLSASLVALAAALWMSAAHAAPKGEPPAPGATPAATPDPKIKLMIVSDSTAADYDAGMTVRGWGQYMPDLLPSRVTVLNRARPGRSAKTYIEEGSWRDALKEKPDFVIVQFGNYNDWREAQRLGWKDTIRNFKIYLGGYVDTARKAGIQPILVTPTAERSFSKDGSNAEDPLGPFVQAMREVAELRRTAFIDLHSQCQQLYNSLGKAKADQLNAMRNDDIHFNSLGAKAVATLVARDLPLIDDRFSQRMMTEYERKMKELQMPTKKMLDMQKNNASNQ